LVSATVTLDCDELVYDGSEKCPGVVKVQLGGDVLEEGLDYEVDYYSNVNAGTAYVEILGIGAFYDSTSCPFLITTAPMQYEVEDVATRYDGNRHSIAVSETRPENGYRLSYSLTEDGPYTEMNPVMVGVSDSARVWYKIDADNYTTVVGYSQVSITPKPLSVNMIKSVDPCMYTGEAQTPRVVVEDGNPNVISSSGYSLLYSRNVSAGKGLVTLTGKNNYSGSVSAEFTIQSAPMVVVRSAGTGADIPGQPIGSYKGVYDGNGHSIAITTESDIGAEIVYSMDAEGPYTSICPIFTNVCDQIKVWYRIAADNYVTTNAFATVTIASKEIRSEMVGQPSDAVYTGKAIQPDIAVIDSQLGTLVKSVDYSVAYENNTAPGLAKVVVSGINNYTAAVERTFSILSGQFVFTKSGDDGSANYDAVYDTYGHGIDVVVSSPLDATIKYALAPDDEYTETLPVFTNVCSKIPVWYCVEKEHYIPVTNVAYVTIRGRAITSDMIKLRTSEYVYDGTEKRPDVTICDPLHGNLKQSEYAVEYENNISAGAARVVVYGLGNYSGTAIGEFTINPATISYGGSKEAPVPGEPTPPSDFSGEYDGLGHGISVNVYSPEEAIVRYGFAADAINSTELPLITNVCTDVAIWFSIDAANHQAITNVALVTISPRDINKATVGSLPDVIYSGKAITPQPAIADEKPCIVTDGDYRVSYANNLNVGTADVTIVGQGNYTGSRTEHFKIMQATYDMSHVSWNYDGPFVYNGEVHQLVLTGLPSGLTVASYVGNVAHDVGAYIAKAKLKSNSDNYVLPNVDDCPWSIEPRSIVGATVTMVPTLWYSGNEQTQQVVSVIIDDLVANVCISNNVATKPGSYTMSIYGMGNFCGCTNINFKMLCESEEIAGHKWLYQTIGDKTRIIAGNVVYPFDGEVVVPEMLGGKPVSEIGDAAFAGATGIVSVIISESITKIGDQAFSGCNMLEQVCFLGNAPEVLGGGEIFAGCPMGMVSYITKESTGWGDAEILPSLWPDNSGRAITNYDAVCISPEGGVVSGTRVTVKLSQDFPKDLENMSVRYTTDGSVPTTSSMEYVSRFSMRLDAEVCIKAAAFLCDKRVTPISETHYAAGITPIPVIDVPVAFDTPTCQASITCDVATAQIYYSITGCSSCVENVLYTGPITITESVKITAYAIAPGCFASDVVTANVQRVITVAQALDAEKFGFSYLNDGLTPWVVDEDVFKQGGSSMRSGDIGDGATTTLQVTGVPAGTISFWWMASCEEDELGEFYYDHGVCLVDGKEVAWIDSLTEWTKVTLTIPTKGLHTITWKYVKDEELYSGADCIWVDEFNWEASIDDGSWHVIPTSWLDQYPSLLEEYGNNYLEATKATTGKSDGGGRALIVWDDYVAGTNPEDLNSKFTTYITIEDGVANVTWKPDLNQGGKKSVRKYTTLGCENLGGTWQDMSTVLETDRSNYRFFKVTVEMP